MGMVIKKTIKKDDTKKLQQIIREVRSKKIKIGIFGNEGSEMLMIASVNEFGCDIKITNKMRWWLHANGLHVKKSTTEIHIPERSFLRKTFNEKKDKIDSFIHDNLDLLFSFQITSEQFLDKVGQYVAGLVQETLTEVTEPANHPFTIKRKNGKSNPLINTGHLRESITWQIE